VLRHCYCVCETWCALKGSCRCDCSYKKDESLEKEGAGAIAVNSNSFEFVCTAKQQQQLTGHRPHHRSKRVPLLSITNAVGPALHAIRYGHDTNYDMTCSIAAPDTARTHCARRSRLASRALSTQRISVRHRRRPTRSSPNLVDGSTMAPFRCAFQRVTRPWHRASPTERGHIWQPEPG